MSSTLSGIIKKNHFEAQYHPGLSGIFEPYCPPGPKPGKSMWQFV